MQMVGTGELKRLIKSRPEPNDAQQLLKVAIIGAPNAGKSTLLNKLLSWKVCLLLLLLSICVVVVIIIFYANVNDSLSLSLVGWL